MFFSNAYRPALLRLVFNGFLTAALMMSGFAAAISAQDEDEDRSGEAIELFQKGQDAHEKGELSAAVGLYEKAIAIIPEFPEAQLQRGNALLSLGRIDDAETAFRRAVELRGEWTLALANLGSLLVGKGQYPEAEKLLLKAVSLNKLNYPAYSALTELRLKTKAKPEALKELLSHLVELTGNAKPAASAWAARGALENALGQREAAKLSLDKALALEPANQAALFARAEAALAEGDVTSADGTIRRLEKIVPNSPQLKLLQARTAFARGNSDAALTILNAVENPSSEILAARDNILATSSDNAAELEGQLAKRPGDPVILGRLCSVLRTADPAKALEMCRRASESDPKNISHAIGYGAALVQAKMFVEAVGLLKRLQAVSPDNVTIRANLATALFQLKRYPEAKAEYRWITDKQPNLPAAFYFLAITHDYLTEYMDAMANYQQFLRLADAEKNKLEIDKVNLRLPALQKQLNKKEGKQTRP